VTRIGRGRRHAGQGASEHDRARTLAAERLDGPLDAPDTAWLDGHLAGCDACRAVASAYEADRLALRGLRTDNVKPPRDLWARTAAAIEQESASHHGMRRGRRASAGRSLPSLGVLSGVAVIAVVIGATALSGGFGFFGGTPGIGTTPDSTKSPLAIASTVPSPGPTPIVVGAGAVGWIGTSADGDLAYNVTDVDEVCPPERQPDCAPVVDGNSKRVSIDAKPRSIFQSPSKNQAVVVGTDASGDDAVIVIALPTADPTADPTGSPPPTTGPTDTPTPSDSPTEPPTATPTATAPDTTPSAPTGSEGPTETPTLTPIPTQLATIAIVSGVTVVGQSAAYSPDGSWFAFTARPSDGSTGPDIYVWRVGEPKATPLTTDHASVFASWLGSRVLGSRPTAGVVDGAEVAAQSFFIDPESGKETPIAGSDWRPVVDRNGTWAVAWTGTVRLAADGVTTVPATGELVLGRFDPEGTSDPTPSSSIAAGPFADFDARWDETGTWLAMWLADPDATATFGRLTLLHLDRETGALDRPNGAPQDVPALPGFSISDGRLAWATPPGQGGEGSRIQIVAWTDKTVGAVESVPVTDVVVVH
jgi:Putative zinc-finger/WD40-like Beta Propeller Repeat